MGAFAAACVVGRAPAVLPAVGTGTGTALRTAGTVRSGRGTSCRPRPAGPPRRRRGTAAAPRCPAPSATGTPSPRAAIATDAPPASASAEGGGPIDWHDQWYAVSFLRDLKEEEPNAFTVMDEPIAVWKEPSSGRWRAFRDSCPHRLVPLTEGRIVKETGMLECPYHGWQFDATGECTAIPEGGKIDHRCDAVVYACTVVQDMLFVKPKPFKRLTNRVIVDGSGALVDLDNLDTSSIPTIPELEDGGITLDIARDFPYDFSLLMENLLDVGHVHFTHHGTISRREKAPVTTLEVRNRSKEGFTGSQVDKAKRDSVFQAPAFLRHTIDRWDEAGSILLIVVYGVPVAPGRCRLLNRQVFKLKSKVATNIIKRLPGWAFHPANNVILEDDVIFLHKQMKEFVRNGSGSKPLGQVYRMPYSSDAFVAAFHKWLERWGGRGPFGPMDEEWLKAAGPIQTQEQLLERHQSHTKDCKSCSAALKFIGVTQRALAIVGGLLAAAACLSTAAVSAVAAGSQALASPTAKAGLLAMLDNLLRSHATSGAHAPTVALMLGAVAVCAAVWVALDRQKQKYLHGTWPPPRNTVP